MKTFAVVAVDGTVTEIPESTPPGDLVTMVGGWLEDVHAQDSSGITAYVDEEATLKEPAVPLNEVASAVLGQPVLGTAILMGPVNPANGMDTGLTDAQWKVVRKAARAAGTA